MNIRNIVLFDLVWCKLSKDDEGFYYCEAIAFDYMSYGDSEDNAIQRFKDCFALTVSKHVEKFGGIEKLLRNTNFPSILQNHVIRQCQKHIDKQEEM